MPIRSKAELKSMLPEIAAGITRTVPEAMTAGAEIMAEAARSKAPVETGALRDSIKVKRRASQDVISVAGRYSSRDIEVGAFYGMFIEFGTVQRPAHPFLVPAYEEASPEVYKLVAAAIKAASRI